LIVILAKLGMSEPLLKPETPVGDYAALAPKAITFLADLAQHFVCSFQFIPCPGVAGVMRSYHCCGAMTCKQKGVLLKGYVDATDRQAKAVSKLVKSKNNHTDFKKAMAEVELAKGTSERARLALKEHTESHGC
jgi:hypothetical protein